MAELLKPGDFKQFNYTGEVQAFDLSPGTYKLECYGAQGGNATGGYLGGKGGYYTGILNVQSPITIYICVGSQGACTNNQAIIAAGGYNGGGNARYNNSFPQYVGAGGGATSITTTNRGILKNFLSYKSEILLVAGGGGGANWWQGKQASHGGAGGGWTGSTGGNAGHVSGTGGTQTAGGTGGASGSFGQGGYGAGISVGSAGGGGGYYGGGASHDNNGGGGGSGYANTSKLTSISYANGKRSGHGQVIITAITVYDSYNLMIINSDSILQELQVYETEKVNISLEQYNALKTFKYWYVKNVNIPNIYSRDITFQMPANDVYIEAIFGPNRLNTNIYKNIFPEEVLNMDFINKSLANTVISTEDIKQDNHGLSANDFVYLDDDGLYKKALAEESTRANVVGIVSKVAGPNVFTLMDSGTVSFDHLDYNDTTILYLSDKIPGKAVHYSDISNTVYIPIAVYIEDKIIIHLQQGSIGDILAPYEKEEQSFEAYTEQELNDVVNQITNGVK